MSCDCRDNRPTLHLIHAHDFLDLIHARANFVITRTEVQVKVDAGRFPSRVIFTYAWAVAFPEGTVRVAKVELNVEQDAELRTQLQSDHVRWYETTSYIY